MSEKDDFVEDLFRDLPKSKALSELDLKRHEKMILAKIEELKKSNSKSSKTLYSKYQRHFQLAAGFLVVLGGISLAVTQNGVNSDNNLDIAIDKSVTPVIPVIPNDNSGQSSENPPVTGTKPNDENSQFDVDNPIKNIYISNTGFEYKSQLQQIMSKVKFSSKPIAISSLPGSYGKCAIELGINLNLLAIDKGTFEGESIVAYFYGDTKSNSSIWIVSKSCQKIAQL